MIQNGLKYLTFVFWILYFIEIMFYRIGVIEDVNLDRKRYLKHINKNFFSSINLKELVLFFIFIIFLQYKNTAVLEILFSAIYIYLLIDFFHTLAYDCKKIHHKMLMVQTVILVFFIIGFFMYTNHLYTTYCLMFSVSVMNSFLMYLFSFPVNRPKKKSKVTKKDVRE